MSLCVIEIRVTTMAGSGRIGCMPPFVPGLELAGAYYAEVVRPLLDEEFAGLPHAAALIDAGSEVLAFDTERSTDHDWGPRQQILLADDAPPGLADQVGAMLSRRLPPAFRGYPTAFAVTRQPGEPARPQVDVAGVGRWLRGRLGFDPRSPVATADWLATPTQRLAEVTGGAVYYDGPGDLSRARARLAWYPRDVWLYVMAGQWQRIGQEEAFPGRCAEAGDELGSVVVTARLVRDLMRLGLLMGRRYPPYSKWLGSAFARLPEAAALGPGLHAAVAGTGWAAREQNLSRAYHLVAAWHNELGVTEPLDPDTRPYFDRPFQVLDAGRFADALRAEITDPELRARPPFGAVDGFIDSSDALGDTAFLRAAIAAAAPA
jgi:hypothetical protein